MALPNAYANAPRLPGGEDLDPRLLVGGPGAPVEIEIGPGRGGFLFERLAADPGARMIGLEVRRKWASIVDARLSAQGLGARCRVLAEDVRTALPRLRACSASVVFLHFPDPWWKKRHRKRLVATPDLLAQTVRILVPGGQLFYQSDVAERALEFERLVAAVPLLLPWEKAGPRITENPYGAMSPRERRATADGLPIVRLRYRRAGDPADAEDDPRP